jgi:transcriptional regulator with XRE-family HTH domain
MERFGEKLRTLREQRNMSRRELAEALGYLSQGHMYDIETGKRKPTLEFAVKVSEYFGVSVDVLVKDDLEVGE